MIQDLVEAATTAAESEFAEKILFVPYIGGEYVAGNPDPNIPSVEVPAIVRRHPKSVVYAKRREADPSAKLKIGFMEATVITSRFAEAGVREPKLDDHIILLGRPSDPELRIVDVGTDGRGRTTLQLHLAESVSVTTSNLNG